MSQESGITFAEKIWRKVSPKFAGKMEATCSCLKVLGLEDPTSKATHSHGWQVNAACWQGNSVLPHKDFSRGLLECPDNMVFPRVIRESKADAAMFLTT